MVDHDCKHTNVQCHVVSGNDNSILWHSHLGHLPYYKLKILSGIQITDNTSIASCDICPRAKQHRYPFPRNHKSATHIFDIVHIDLWGPYQIPKYNGYYYFITIVDDHSRATWTHLLTTKSNAMSIIQAFTHMTETQFNTKVKCIRSDNALELGSIKEATAFLISKGIIHQTRCVERPQQNGVVESKYKHLLETSRALLFQLSLPMKFWGECVLTATYLINRFPTKLLKGKSPYEVLFGVQPSYDHLKTFGCLCYVSTLKQGRTKFDLRASKCVFIGYPMEKRGYKVYNLETHKIQVSKDVIFLETIFPFHSPNCNPDHSHISSITNSINPILFHDISPSPPHSATEDNSSPSSQTSPSISSIPHTLIPSPSSSHSCSSVFKSVHERT